ncbi:MAG: hypothetical protein FNT15_05920 [Sulfurovum sp.]|nr:MAG: hypothetical protein FNT15_05920 [Sulfurovum sp.]
MKKFIIAFVLLFTPLLAVAETFLTASLENGSTLVLRTSKESSCTLSNNRVQVGTQRAVLITKKGKTLVACWVYDGALEQVAVLFDDGDFYYYPATAFKIFSNEPSAKSGGTSL